MRAALAVRKALIRTRAQWVALVKALGRREGLRLPSGEPQHTVTRLAALLLSPTGTAELAPVVARLMTAHDASGAGAQGAERDQRKKMERERVPPGPGTLRDDPPPVLPPGVRAAAR